MTDCRICRILSFNHLKHNNVTTTMPNTIKLSRVVTYYEGLAPIESHNLLITWSYEIR